jgi:hypothetical protein
MFRARRRWIGPFAAATLSLFARGAQASDVPVAFEYRAPSDCPAEQELVRQVQARTQRARLALPGQAASKFAIQIARDSTATRGTLVVHPLHGGADSVREVSAGDCVEVVSALALVVALVIDPNASTDPLPPEQPAEQGLEPPPEAPSPPVPETPHFRWGLEASLGVTGGIAPDLAPLVGIAATVSREPGGIWAPLLSFGVVAAQSFEVDAADGTAVFGRLAARLAFCPIRAPAVGTIALRPCALVEAGALRGEGFDTPDAASATVLWLAGGAALRFEISVAELVMLGAEGGATFPAFHDRFFFDPRRAWEYEVPAVGGWATLLGGVRFR